MRFFAIRTPDLALAITAHRARAERADGRSYTPLHMKLDPLSWEGGVKRQTEAVKCNEVTVDPNGLQCRSIWMN
jgi:hypothetical protein